VPSLYFAEALPYVAVMTISVTMYKKMGMSNTDLALYTSWLYLPWVIKPLWSPFVDAVKTKRWWIWAMQLLIGAALAVSCRPGLCRNSLHHSCFLLDTGNTGLLLAHSLLQCHPRHRRRRLLHPGTRQPRPGHVCRHTQHVLPHSHYFRSGRPRHACRLAGTFVRIRKFLVRWKRRFRQYTFFLGRHVPCHGHPFPLHEPLPPFRPS